MLCATLYITWADEKGHLSPQLYVSGWIGALRRHSTVSFSYLEVILLKKKGFPLGDVGIVSPSEDTLSPFSLSIYPQANPPIGNVVYLFGRIH